MTNQLETNKERLQEIVLKVIEEKKAEKIQQSQEKEEKERRLV